MLGYRGRRSIERRITGYKWYNLENGRGKTKSGGEKTNTEGEEENNNISKSHEEAYYHFLPKKAIICKILPINTHIKVK